MFFFSDMKEKSSRKELAYMEAQIYRLIEILGEQVIIRVENFRLRLWLILNSILIFKF